MTLHAVWVHLQNNWHKYGILFLVLKELKGVYTFITNLKGISETFTWLKNKIRGS